MNRSIRVFALAAALASAFAWAGPAVVPLTLPSGKVLRSEVMTNDQDRAMGLMFRSSLDPDKGMLFVFDSAEFHGIWMKNCKFPIDILWLDADHNVVDLAESVPPCKTEKCPVYQPLHRASFVVELNAGQARREKATVGANVSFTLPK